MLRSQLALGPLGERALNEIKVGNDRTESVRRFRLIRTGKRRRRAAKNALTD